jgi:hypothetical protein
MSETVLSRMMRFLNKKEPKVFEETGAVPVNAMGSSSSTAGTGGVDTFDPLMKTKKKKLRDIIKR